MNEKDQEIEVKFYLSDLPKLEQRIQSAGGVRMQARVHESNLRYDLPDGSLTSNHQVLRLRKDVNSILTYKGPSSLGETVNIRQEIETTVGDFAAAQRILEALGYRIAVMYEKWRTTYRLGVLEIVLDEMPFGNFCEIEGPDAETIRLAANSLHLDWESRITDSYLGMFWRLKSSQSLPAENLDFASFQEITITHQDLGVIPADRQRD